MHHFQKSFQCSFGISFENINKNLGGVSWFKTITIILKFKVKHSTSDHRKIVPKVPAKNLVIKCTKKFVVKLKQRSLSLLSSLNKKRFSLGSKPCSFTNLIFIIAMNLSLLVPALQSQQYKSLYWPLISLIHKSLSPFSKINKK